MYAWLHAKGTTGKDKESWRNQYNELVLAADTLNSLLGPTVIEAVYMLPHTAITDAVLAYANYVHERRNVTAIRNPRLAEYRAGSGAELARSVHSRLLRHFNLTAQQLPLLELNISDRVAPFRPASPLRSLVMAAGNVVLEDYSWQCSPRRLVQRPPRR